MIKNQAVGVVVLIKLQSLLIVNYKLCTSF